MTNAAQLTACRRGRNGRASRRSDPQNSDVSTADLAIVIAGYGAFVGTGSLGWQVYVWRRKLRADVRVEVTHSVERGLAAEHGDDVVRAFEYQIAVAAVNAGETVEHLKSLRIENPDGERLELHERRWRRALGATEPPSREPSGRADPSRARKRISG